MVVEMKYRFEFKLQDCWIGVFWRTTDQQWISNDAPEHGKLWIPSVGKRIDIWICLIPMFPLHILYCWGERLMTIEEFENQLASGMEE